MKLYYRHSYGTNNFFLLERPPTYPNLYLDELPCCTSSTGNDTANSSEPPNSRKKYHPPGRDKHASAPSGTCQSIGRSHGAKLGYRLSAVSSQTQKECGGSVRPFRSSRLHMWISHSYPPMTDKPPEAGEEERSRDFGGPVSGVYLVYSIFCHHWNGSYTVIPLIFIQS